MPNPPYPFNAANMPEFRLQGWRLFRDLYEERIAGCRIEGDVFMFEGDRDLEFNYASTGCLETTTNGCSVTIDSDSGFNLNEAGLGLVANQSGLNTDGSYAYHRFRIDVGSWVGHRIYVAWQFDSASYVTNICFAVTKNIGLDYWDYVSNEVLPGGQYGFYPCVIILSYSIGGYQYSDFYAWQTYITSSGETWWMFFKVDKTTGEINSAYFAHDHPCFGNGNDPLLVQHPFGEVDDNEEIVVINPTEEQVRKIRHLCRPQRIGEAEKPFMQFIGEGKLFNIGNEEREYPRKKVTVGIVEDEDMRPLWHKESAKIMQCRIPQPDYVKVRNLHEYN